MLSVADVARILVERAQTAALPGKQVAECNAVWCELGQVLRLPAPEPRRPFRLVASEPR